MSDAPPLMTVEISEALPPLIRPPALQKGDAIGVVAPSYSPREGWLQRGVKALERAGYTVLLDPEIGEIRRFQRSEDERRAENFMGMWLDPRVKAVIGGTGGYGAVRMLPHLDPEIFRRNPKPFVGYSDITAIHLWLMRRAGLRVFHGPTVDDLATALELAEAGGWQQDVALAHELAGDAARAEAGYAAWGRRSKLGSP